jgi:FG-GAP-like repeat
MLNNLLARVLMSSFVGLGMVLSFGCNQLPNGSDGTKSNSTLLGGPLKIAINATLLDPTFAVMGPSLSSGMPFAARLAFINATLDGYSDIAVFSPNFVNGVMDSNHSNVLVYSGKDSSLLYKLTGNYYFGRSLDSAGNFNHSGVDDLVVGAPSCSGCGGAGQVLVYSGKDQSLIFSMSGGTHSLLGWVVAGVGDVNGDGYDDVLVTDPSYSNNRGIVYVISGQDHSILFSAMGENQGDYFGQSASRFGDLDGDGLPDIIIGTRDFQSQVSGTQLTGKVYAYSPKSNNLLWSKVGGSADGLGIGVSAAGDFNGDGIPDVIAQAGISNQVYVLSGVDGSTLYQQKSVQPYYFGLNTASLGDIEGTGYSDIALGDNMSGTVQIVSGKKKSVIAKITANTADVMGNPGAVVVGGSNFNGDGKPNLAIAAINARASVSDGNPRGKVYVVSPTDLIKSLK